MSLYQSILRPALFKFDEEWVHESGVRVLELGLGSSTARRISRRKYTVDGFGTLKRFGVEFANPIGVAAGFDKNGRIHRQLSALGFGFVEIGTVTFEAQPGNPLPRLFRIPDDKAIINRLGFNNAGARKMSQRLERFPKESILGINIGKNKSVPNDESVANYLDVFNEVKPFADYVTVNVSSPNTPGLRELQKIEPLDLLLEELIKANNAGGRPVPLLLKVAPDLERGEVEAISEVCLNRRIDGIIATNTTSGRKGLSISEDRINEIGAGGLSGAPLKSMSTDVLSQLFSNTKGVIPIVGVGGIFDANDAFEKILAGASLLQVYTGFIYHGPGIARSINKGLLKLLEDNGFESLDAAVGAGL